MIKKAAVIVVLFALLLVAATSGCIQNQIKETQTTAQPNSAASAVPAAGQAQVSVNAQYQTYTPRHNIRLPQNRDISMPSSTSQ